MSENNIPRLLVSYSIAGSSLHVKLKSKKTVFLVLRGISFSLVCIFFIFEHVGWQFIVSNCVRWNHYWKNFQMRFSKGKTTINSNDFEGAKKRNSSSKWYQMITIWKHYSFLKPHDKNVDFEHLKFARLTFVWTFANIVIPHGKMLLRQQAISIGHMSNRSRPATK